MSKNRMEAFSDGVFAVIITIMVLEMRAPHGADLTALRPLIPVFLSYVLSFIFLGIYWSNHHHLLQVVDTFWCRSCGWYQTAALREDFSLTIASSLGR